MQMFFRTLIVSLALFLTCAALAHAADSQVGVLEIDPSKTLVEFRLGGSLHTTHGTFQLRRGTIKADGGSGNAEGIVIVDAASGDSGEKMRDDRMKEKVLETNLYPEITFFPRRIDAHLDPGGAFSGRIEGVLKLHGDDHDITVNTQGTLVGDSLVATAHFSVPYVEWGLHDPSVLFLKVEKSVDIDIATAGHVTWTNAKSSDSSK